MQLWRWNANSEMPWSEATRLQNVRLSKLRQILADAPSDSINLALGELAFPFPRQLADQVISLMAKPKPAYTPNAGNPDLRAKIALSHNAHAENICICNGAEEALYISLQALVNPGDLVAIPDPDYPAYPTLAHLAGADVIRLPLGTDFQSIDWDLWETSLKKAKAILMSHPSNPTGFCFEESGIERLCNILNKHDIILIVDTIYSEVYTEMPYYPDYQCVRRCVVIGGLSKSHLMSGWRIGWIYADNQVIRAATKLKQYISTCSAWISQELALYALDHAEIPLLIQTQLKENQGLVREFLNKKELHIPSSTPYIMIKANEPDREVKAYLARGVITLCGSAFGSVSKDWIRINYAVDSALLRKALKRMQ